MSDVHVLIRQCLLLSVSGPPEVRGAEGANEEPERGDGPMDGLRGEPGPSGRAVGVLEHLLPHLQEPRPAPTHHEHR